MSKIGKGVGKSAAADLAASSGKPRGASQSRASAPDSGRAQGAAQQETAKQETAKRGTAGQSHVGESRAGTIDAFNFARLGKEASGSLPLVRFARVVEDLPPQPTGEAGLVRWSVRGETGRQGEPLLHVRVQASPVLVCQRCMEPFPYPVDTDVTLQLVKSEAELDDGMGDVAQDGDNDDGPVAIDDSPEKVLGSRHFDLLGQVEDELILSIPYVPRHDVCPGASRKTSAGDPALDTDEKRPSPFAVLEKLKQKV
jgi:uncharacterized protein